MRHPLTLALRLIGMGRGEEEMEMANGMKLRWAVVCIPNYGVKPSPRNDFFSSMLARRTRSRYGQASQFDQSEKIEQS